MFESVEAYIESFPPDVQAKLEAVRDAIRAAAPGTEETITYDIPTFTLGGKYVVYFAGWKRHISVYPIPDRDDALTRELQPYLSGKGTLKFPLDEPLPLELIGKVADALVRRRLSSRAAPSG
jgi:uncharacterized protein YdhG (YjbR/CyaY superfamily)